MTKRAKGAILSVVAATIAAAAFAFAAYVAGAIDDPLDFLGLLLHCIENRAPAV